MTLVDNDRPATEAIIPNASEGSKPTDGEFTIRLNGIPPVGGVRVHFTMSGTATAGDDYTATGTAFADGYVGINQQADRSATIAVSGNATVTIAEDDTSPPSTNLTLSALSVGDVSIADFNDPAVTITAASFHRIVATPTDSEVIRIAYAIVSASATGAEDYEITVSTVGFSNGASITGRSAAGGTIRVLSGAIQSSANGSATDAAEITVTITPRSGDNSVEAAEIVILSLAASSGYTYAEDVTAEDIAARTVTIADSASALLDIGIGSSDGAYFRILSDENTVAIFDNSLAIVAASAFLTKAAGDTDNVDTTFAIFKRYTLQRELRITLSITADTTSGASATTAGNDYTELAETEITIGSSTTFPGITVSAATIVSIIDNE